MNSKPKFQYSPPENPAVGEVYYSLERQSHLFWTGEHWVSMSSNDTAVYKYRPRRREAVMATREKYR